METNVPPPPPPPLTGPHTYQQPPIIVNVPPPARSGRGWMLLSLVLLGLLGLMVVGNLLSALFSVGETTGAQSGSHFREVTVENPMAKDKIAIIAVEGMITSEPWDPAGRSMVDAIEDQLKLAAKDSEVKAVILKVDSPGGEVMASDDISRAIITFQEKNKKPVLALMGGLAASGGYYVSAPCQWIIANELTLTGSIGVILHTFNYRGLMDKVGLMPVIYKSGRFKDMLSGSKRPEDIDPTERQMVQDMIDETFAKFKQVVKDGRDKASTKNKGKGKTLASNWEEYADGRVLTGKAAHDLGFVDELGNFQTAVDRTRNLAGITGEAHLIRYQEPFSLSRLFGVMGEAEGKETTVKLDVGLNFPKIEAGRPYFLSPTVVQ